MRYNLLMSKEKFQHDISKLSLNEKINFFTEFYSYLGSAIPLTTTLANIQKYSNSPNVKEIAILLLAQVDKGENFADAILTFKKAFGNVYCNLMSIGAQSGELPKITKEILDSLKKQRSVIYQIIMASIYPAFLFFMLIGASLLLFFYIAPRLASQYQSVTGEGLTDNMKSMLSITTTLTNNWFFIIFTLGLIVWGIISFAKHLKKSELGIKFPVIGQFIRYYNLSIFSKLLAISYAAGLPISHGILLSSESVGNEFIQKKLVKCATYIARHPLADSFAGTGFFTPQMISKIQAGETTGKLDEVLHEISDEIDETLGTVVASGIQLLSPILMVIIAIFIIFFGSTLMNAIFMI